MMSAAVSDRLFQIITFIDSRYPCVLVMNDISRQGERLTYSTDSVYFIEGLFKFLAVKNAGVTIFVWAR
jgi:hypothetical protein